MPHKQVGIQFSPIPIHTTWCEQGRAQPDMWWRLQAAGSPRASTATPEGERDRCQSTPHALGTPTSTAAQPPRVAELGLRGGSWAAAPSQLRGPVMPLTCAPHPPPLRWFTTFDRRAPWSLVRTGWCAIKDGAGRWGLGTDILLYSATHAPSIYSHRHGFEDDQARRHRKGRRGG